MLQVKSFTFNPFQENTYVIYDSSRECIIIDPGCYDRDEQEELTAFIRDNDLTVLSLLNTHCHIDHVLGNYFVKEKYKTNLYIHKIEEPYLRAVKTYASNYGIVHYDETTADGFLAENDIITVGAQQLSVLFVPGHSAGHIAFYDQESKILLAGDVLFYNSIGRTDLPGGNYDTLISSIHEKLFILPDDVTVYPGHGPKTTIGFEKRTNPFCAIHTN